MSSNNSRDRASLCAFTFPDGRQCRMPRHSKESPYCLSHERMLLELATAFGTNTYEKQREGECLSGNHLHSALSVITNLSLQNSPPSNNSKNRTSLCAFTFSDGRQCRMLLHSKKSRYCFHHERKLRHLRQADQTAFDVCEPMDGDFVPATALTQSLTRAFRAVAEGRIDHKTASALSRLASTLLKSIGASSDEFQSCYLESYWRQLVREHYVNVSDYIPATPRPPRRQSTNSTDNSNSSNSSGSNSSNYSDSNS